MLPWWPLLELLKWLSGDVTHWTSNVHTLAGCDWESMMMSSNGNIFFITGPLWGESTSHWWIPLTNASDTELWHFLWSVSEQTVEQTIGTLVIWDAVALIMMSLQWKLKLQQIETLTRHGENFFWFLPVNRFWPDLLISNMTIQRNFSSPTCTFID